MKKIKVFTIYPAKETEANLKFGYNVKVVAKDIETALKAINCPLRDVDSFSSEEVYSAI